MTSTFDAICPSLTRMPVSFPSGALVQGNLPSRLRAAKKMNFSAIYERQENKGISLSRRVGRKVEVEEWFPEGGKIG
ncbi:hypothetical protein [uncultured Mameliella sp.]|uniref:hypothetical protein n=1 Tax=uncultured Mameliella sp. TaxID=1447087 RepID=UPI002623C55F|nr:hypothetical protein [uncultured Mameliella sp.]